MESARTQRRLNEGGRASTPKALPTEPSRYASAHPAAHRGHKLRDSIALPPGVELHHIDDNPLNASAFNNVAVYRPEHNAWHSRKG